MSYSVEIPPLRERLEDIIPLAEAFIKHFARKMKKTDPGTVSADSRTFSCQARCPAMFGSSKHAMERAVALGRGKHNYAIRSAQ